MPSTLHPLPPLRRTLNLSCPTCPPLPPPRFLYVSRSRNKVFSKEWAESEGAKSLEDEHKKATGSVKLPKDGYPDMGNGRFAATLPYADWLSFNNAQRAHYNLLEIFPSALGLHVLSGIFYPVPTAASAVLWIAARHSWSSNYVSVIAHPLPNACAVKILTLTPFPPNSLRP